MHSMTRHCVLPHLLEGKFQSHIVCLGYMLTCLQSSVYKSAKNQRRSNLKHKAACIAMSTMCLLAPRQRQLLIHLIICSRIADLLGVSRCKALSSASIYKLITTQNTPGFLHVIHSMYGSAMRGNASSLARSAAHTQSQVTDTVAADQ